MKRAMISLIMWSMGCATLCYVATTIPDYSDRPVYIYQPHLESNPFLEGGSDSEVGMQDDFFEETEPETFLDLGKPGQWLET